jgi:hypothetical protein
MSEVCSLCSKELSLDEVGLTLKYFGTDYKDRYCKQCCAKKLECSEEKLDEMIEFFRSTGCPLFN